MWGALKTGLWLRKRNDTLSGTEIQEWHCRGHKMALNLKLSKQWQQAGTSQVPSSIWARKFIPTKWLLFVELLNLFLSSFCTNVQWGMMLHSHILMHVFKTRVGKLTHGCGLQHKLWIKKLPFSYFRDSPGLWIYCLTYGLWGCNSSPNLTQE